MCIFIKEYRQRKSLLVEFYSFYCLLYFECFFKFAKRSHFVKILTKFHIPLCAMDINKENSYTRKTPVVCIRMKGFKNAKVSAKYFPLEASNPSVLCIAKWPSANDFRSFFRICCSVSG